MSREWWAVVIGSFIVGAVLIGTGFLLFEDGRFLENLIVEAIGMAVALGIVVWLIEGPVLTHERRLRAISDYKWRVYQRSAEIGHILAREIAQPIASDFELAINLYGDERGKWDDFEPLLRLVFKRARDVPKHGLPQAAHCDERFVRSCFEACMSMNNRIREVISTKPEFKNHVSLVDTAVYQIESHIKRAERLHLLQDQAMRYEVTGELGDLVLNLLDTLTPLPEDARPQKP